jgi:hypothetical protein
VILDCPICNEKFDSNNSGPIGVMVIPGRYLVCPNLECNKKAYELNQQNMDVKVPIEINGELGAYYCVNGSGGTLNTATSYIQIFDTSGTVTLGTTTPKWSIGLLPSGGANLEFANGLNFANAIKIAATTTATGSTAPSTNVDCNFAYK